MKNIIPFIIALTLLINSPYTLLFAVSDDVYIVSHSGDVRVIRAGTNVGIACKDNMSLSFGDLIHAGDSSTVTIGHVGETSYMAKISENSLVEILDGKPMWLDLSDGKLLARLYGVKEGEEFIIRTPVGACGARGTGWEMMTDGIDDEVKVFESKVLYYGLDPYGELSTKGVEIREGFKRKIKKYEKPGNMEVLDSDELFELWQTAGEMVEQIKTSEGIKEIGNIGTNK